MAEKTGRERVAHVIRMRLATDPSDQQKWGEFIDYGSALGADLDSGAEARARLERVREMAGPVRALLDSPYTCNVSSKLREDLSALLRAIDGSGT